MYSKVVAEQLRAENPDATDLEQHINDLNNIVTYDNSSNMNAVGMQGLKSAEYPSQLLLKVRQDELTECDPSKKANCLLPPEQFRKFALNSLENYSKKNSSQVHREKALASKKFTVASTNKSKPKK